MKITSRHPDRSPPELFEQMYEATMEGRWDEAWVAMDALKRAGWLILPESAVTLAEILPTDDGDDRLSTSRSTWKKSEGRAASVFGTKRQPCSGSGGRADLTCSDSVHPTLFIESKLRERHAVRTLFDETKELAKREHKTPVLMLADKNRPGHLVVVHTDDLRAVVVE